MNAKLMFPMPSFPPLVFDICIMIILCFYGSQHIYFSMIFDVIYITTGKIKEIFCFTIQI
jgi:hypothetical protein